jgi:hypothetical protein
MKEAQGAETIKASLYKSQAEQLIQAINSQSDGDSILKLADTLTLSGLRLLPGLIIKYPVCEEYLNAINAVGPTLKDLSLDDIEGGYHSDGKLPETPAISCYHGKDLVVHPATVAAMAKGGLTTDEQRQAAVREIEEVLGHLVVVTGDKVEHE